MQLFTREFKDYFLYQKIFYICIKKVHIIKIVAYSSKEVKVYNLNYESTLNFFLLFYKIFRYVKKIRKF